MEEVSRSKVFGAGNDDIEWMQKILLQAVAPSLSYVHILLYKNKLKN